MSNTPAAAIANLTEKHVSRFWAKVDRSGGDATCWIWVGATTVGYGCLRVRPVTLYAHRIAYTLNIGPIPDGLFVLHRCDVKRCVNPSHLFLGDAAENARDCVAKGRQARGETHHWAKLTSEQVMEIRQLRGKVKQSVLAERFGVVSQCISMIQTGRRWS